VHKDADEVQLERSRSRESALEVTFGLKVRIKALRDVDAVLNNIKLKSGTQVEATLEDKIVFHNDSEMDLLDLRRRARAMGGRFQLKASKSEYLVSNNPSLLEEDDILLSPGTSGDVLLKILCDYDKRVGTLEVIDADRPIMVGETPVRGTALLQDGDTIRIDVGQFLRCNFSERIIEEERNIIRSLEVVDVNHRFTNSEVALEGISFTVNRGELVCVMGASGSGKSTLMKVLGGQLQPVQGQVLLNDRPLYETLDQLKGYISYIPQEDAFDEHLTIGENLQFAAAIRAPHLSGRDLTRRLEGKLIELGLNERRDSIVGSPVKKTLSGGERKRLNIGLDMIGSADVYLFDEPTSGLSSKDSEHVIEIIRALAHNKIIIVTIHQPSSKLFQMFHKAILFDKGGRLVFFGTPTDMLRYFAEAEHQHQFGAELGACQFLLERRLALTGGAGLGSLGTQSTEGRARGALPGLEPPRSMAAQLQAKPRRASLKNTWRNHEANEADWPLAPGDLCAGRVRRGHRLGRRGLLTQTGDGHCVRRSIDARKQCWRKNCMHKTR